MGQQLRFKIRRGGSSGSQSPILGPTRHLYGRESSDLPPLAQLVVALPLALCLTLVMIVTLGLRPPSDTASGGKVEGVYDVPSQPVMLHVFSCSPEVGWLVVGRPGLDWRYHSGMARE